VVGVVLGLIVGLGLVAIVRHGPERTRVGFGAPGAAGASQGGAGQAPVTEFAALGQGQAIGAGPATATNIYEPGARGSGTGGLAPGAIQATGITQTHGAVRGVSANSVTIGVAVLDLSAVKYLGPEYDPGDVPGQWNAVLADWHDRHLVPVNGRDIQFAFESYSVLSNDDQRRACTALIDDDQSFAVDAIEFFYQTGSDCVAHEKRTPLLTSEGPTDEVFAHSTPYLFSLQMSQSRLLRNFVYWADSRGVLKGHRLGIYHSNDAAEEQLIHATIYAEMAKLHYPPPVEFETSDPLGGYEDALAVQKFQSSGVDVAMLMTAQGGFTQQADAQRYHPTYIQTDYNGGTSDIGTNTYAADQYDGTYAMTTLRRGEPAAGIPPTPDERACVDNYNRRSGHHVAPAGQGGHETAEWVFVVLSCDEGKILLHALSVAGRELTPASFVAGLESVRDTVMIRYPNVSFGPGKYQGVDAQRTLRWHADCTCWRAIGSFGPLWVP